MQHSTFKSNDGLLETSELGNENKQTRETSKVVSYFLQCSFRPFTSSSRFDWILSGRTWNLQLKMNLNKFSKACTKPNLWRHTWRMPSSLWRHTGRTQSSLSSCSILTIAHYISIFLSYNFFRIRLFNINLTERKAWWHFWNLNDQWKCCFFNS